MDLLRRLLGFGGPDEHPDESSAVGELVAAPGPDTAGPAGLREAPQRAIALACPSCAALLDPPPVRNRLCPRCRQPIVVRRMGGRIALLTEAAVKVFEAERQRELEERDWTAARRRWLGLARNVKASPARRAKLEAAPLSADVVKSSRALYLTTAERAVKVARRERRWGDVGRILREEAAALYDEAGTPIPPPDEIAGVHREGMVAVLRSLQPFAKAVELVSNGCCPTCRADDGRTFEIQPEVRAARLPHDGCPKGLCGCDWWPALVEPRKRRRRAPTTAVPARRPTGPAADRPVDPESPA